MLKSPLNTCSLLPVPSPLLPPLLLHPPRLFQLLRQDPLDLAIDAAEFVGGPFLQGLIYFCVHTKDKVFLIAQDWIYLCY